MGGLCDEHSEKARAAGMKAAQQRPVRTWQRSCDRRQQLRLNVWRQGVGIWSRLTHHGQAVEVERRRAGAMQVRQV